MWTFPARGGGAREYPFLILSCGVVSLYIFHKVCVVDLHRGHGWSSVSCLTALAFLRSGPICPSPVWPKNPVFPLCFLHHNYTVRKWKNKAWETEREREKEKGKAWDNAIKLPIFTSHHHLQIFTAGATLRYQARCSTFRKIHLLPVPQTCLIEIVHYKITDTSVFVSVRHLMLCLGHSHMIATGLREEIPYKYEIRIWLSPILLLVRGLILGLPLRLRFKFKFIFFLKHIFQ